MLRYITQKNPLTAGVITLVFIALSLPLLVVIILWMGVDRRLAKRKRRKAKQAHDTTIPR